ncbi:response regulator [Halonotius terrestris]|uniref:histidine kinase n=1 Tax=Halonotius terrestris TaxID=2487750 RepID=A0A8J8TAU3_9EURY|nr:hybrid sensor histidine kinase/response regulator [Halonotius terrestris]TQQ79743.1 response regulator [Halonotius terrestris]
MSRADAAFHLLYVDGTPECRDAVRAAFEPEWAVTTVETGQAAGEAVDTDIDCFVAAADLPDTDGISLYESLDDTESIPSVLFVDESNPELIRAAFRAGIDDVIYKPTADDVDAHASTRGADSQPADGGAAQSPGAPTPGESEAALAETVDASVPDGIAGLRSRLIELLTEQHASLQGTTLNVSRSLMSAAADEVDVKIEWALQSLATELEANQCLLYEYDSDDEVLRETFGWRDAETDASAVADETSAPIGNEEISVEEFPGFSEQLQQFEPVCYDATQPAADDADRFDAEQGTLLALPIIIEFQLTGTIVITTDIPRTWTESIRQQLTAVGELIGHTDRRRRRRTELKEQNERLEQFTSVISHDLQNPLSVVTGYLELAQDTGDTDHLEPAVEAAERMEQMLNELLTLAREGRAVGDTEPVDIATVVAQAWSAVDTPDATLTTDELETLDQVSADPTRLQEAFENLFRNALDHVGEDVAITVSATDNGVAVADDGPGISPEQRDEVFEHGYTGGNGTGLGLSIVETIIEGHGWDISIDESDEGGAKFVITFDDE